MNLLKVDPATLVNDSFLVRDPMVLELLKHLDPSEVFVNFEDTYQVFQANTDLEQTAFLQVITETVFEYPHNSFSEKTWKPVVSMRPFIIAGVPGSIQNLQELGFKTFDRWWNEEYDNINDSVQRLIAITNIVEEIANKSIGELQKILVDMQPVLEHNRNHYYSEFRDQWIKQIHKKCQQNLLPR